MPNIKDIKKEFEKRFGNEWGFLVKQDTKGKYVNAEVVWSFIAKALDSYREQTIKEVKEILPEITDRIGKFYILHGHPFGASDKQEDRNDWLISHLKGGEKK